MWEVLAAYPRRDYESPLRQHAEREAAAAVAGETPAGILWAFSMVLLVTPQADLRPRLEAELDGIFTAFPDATLWLVAVDDRLPARVSLMHILFQQRYTPELVLADPASPFRRSLTAQSLTNGVNFADAVSPVLLTFSPAATGIAIPWPPHVLVLEWAAVVGLTRKPHETVAACFAPRVLEPSQPTPPGPWVNRVPKRHLGSLLAWWVHKLDVLYTIATDPTRFTSADGRHDPAAQLAFVLSVERLLADLTLLLGDPSAPTLARLSVAFDALDKLETLLGFGPSGTVGQTGEGFQRLLSARASRPALERGLRTAPLQLREVLVNRLAELYERVFRETIAEVLPGRLAAGGVRIGVDAARVLAPDDYVPLLVRLVRNSSHGLLDQLAKSKNLDVVATHTGALPADLPALVALIVTAVLGQPEVLWGQCLW